MGSNLLIPTTGGDVVVLVAGTPTNGQAITWDAATARNVYSTISGGTPGGSNTQIQYNNAGVFGGSANLTWDGSSMLVVGLFRTSTIDPTGFSGSGIDTPGTIGAIGDLGGNGNATVMRIDDLSLYVKVQAGNSGLLADNPTGVTTVGDIDAQGNSSVLAIDDDNQRATFNKKFVITDTGSFYLWNAGTSTYWYYTPDAVTGVLVPTDTGSGSLP